MTMVIAVLVENVETILGLNGALMGTFIAFILRTVLLKNTHQGQLTGTVYHYEDYDKFRLFIVCKLF